MGASDHGEEVADMGDIVLEAEVRGEMAAFDARHDNRIQEDVDEPPLELLWERAIVLRQDL